MKEQDIHLSDWKRIVFGSAPPEFMIEVLIRSILIYVAFIITARYLGKRMNGQLTITEMAVMVTLGAIVSPIMQLPDRGILLGFVALYCALLFQRGWNWLGVKNSKIEEVAQGRESVLIKDGILQLDEMEKSRISKQQVFAALRSNNIYNVHKVKRLYFEACGLFSIYTIDDGKPGLSTLPPTDQQVQEILQPANGEVVCQNCGNTVPVEKVRSKCDVCHAQKWVEAVC